ncbi:MAG: serine hydrolase domain-containing protein [Nakamurella sp.]
MTASAIRSDNSIDERSVSEAMVYYDTLLAFQRGFLRVPGIQAAVRLGGRLMFSGAYGESDLLAGTPLTERHLFRIASHSKTFTSTAIHQLAAMGTVRLDDSEGQWVPELAAVDAPLANVTIRALLSHSAGIWRDSGDGDFWQLQRPFPDGDTLLGMLIADGAAVLGPNERFKYSNIGYGLLGRIIEAATGRTYQEHLQDAVVDQLGLLDTGPEYDPARAADYASGHSALSYNDSRVPIDHVDTRALAAAAGFYSTARDLTDYFSAHCFGDDRLLSDASKRQMQLPVWDTEVADRRYALGLAVMKVGDRRMIGHGGGYPGHITCSVVDPHAGLAVSAFTSAIDGPAELLAHHAVKLIDLAESKPRGDVGATSRFTGRFASLWGVTDIALLGGRLYRLHPAKADLVDDAAELEVVDDRTVRVVGGSGYGSFGEPFRYDFDADGTVRSVRGESASTMVPIEKMALPERFEVGQR